VEAAMPRAKVTFAEVVQGVGVRLFEVPGPEGPVLKADLTYPLTRARRRVRHTLGLARVLTKTFVLERLLPPHIDDLKVQSVTPPEGPLFRVYAGAWLAGCEARGLKHTTYRSYAVILKIHLLPAFGDLPLRQIDRKAVRALALAKRQAGASLNSVRLILVTLSSIFSSAIEDGLVQHNPALRPGRFIKLRGRQYDVNPLSHAEEVAFLEAVQAHAPLYYPFFLFLLRAGCRLGEAIALRPGDLDFRGRFIEVRRNFTNGRLTTPKNGKMRRVDMSKGLCRVLKEHLTTLELEAAAKGMIKPEWVFPNKHGGILDADNLRHRVFYRVLEAAGLRRVRIHDLRHSFASRLIANRESLAYVRDQMGHSSIQVTVDLYGHLVPGANKQAVDRLDEPYTPDARLAGEHQRLDARDDVGDVGDELVTTGAGSGTPDRTEPLEKPGAGEWGRTTDLLIRNLI